MAYLLLKYVHVLFAITALGSNITYGAWYARSARESEHLAFALRGIKFIDDYIANPCYGLLLVTGLALVFIGKWPWPRWILTAVVLYGVLIVLALAGYSPALRRQVAALGAEGAQSPAYQQWAARARVTGIATIPLVLAIVFMMGSSPNSRFESVLVVFGVLHKTSTRQGGASTSGRDVLRREAHLSALSAKGGRDRFLQSTRRSRRRRWRDGRLGTQRTET